jgi:hypothetical protein
VIPSGTEKNYLKNCWQPKRTAQETFLQSVLQNEGNCWPEFYKYMKRWKENREMIPAIKDHNRTIIMDSTEKANILNSYYASIFCCDHYTKHN